jgi:spore maturation protein CgeB
VSAPLRFSFYGSSLVSAYWNGAATYYRGIIRALARLGHEVVFYEPDAYERQAHRDIADPSWARVVVYEPTVEAMERVLADGAGADVVVKCSGVGVLDAELEAGVLEHRRGAATIAYWDVDAPATLERMEADPADSLRALLPSFDLILTYGGGDPVVDRFARLGNPSCVPVYNALDPETHHPAAPDPRFEGLLGLLANRLPDRERRVEDFFLAAAAALPEERFVLGGSGWGDKPITPNVGYVGHVYTRDHNAFNVTPRAVLNIARDSMARNGFSPATRVFEAAGAGACLISDAWEGIELFLEPGREVLVAASGDELVGHLRELDVERARTIGAAARRRVLAEHTYDHRATQLQALLDARAAVGAGR